MPPLHHIADVGLILQHIGNAFTTPLAGIGARIGHRQPRIGGWGRNTFCVQLSCDLPAAHAILCHAEDPPHRGRHFLVNDDLVLFSRVHFVAIYRFAADKLPLALLISLDTLDLLGDVLGVHIVHDGPERRNVVGCGLHAGVDTVQQGNVSHPLFWEVPLHIVAGHDVVTAQSAQVLGNDHVDLLGLNVLYHALKGRTVER